MVHLSKRILAVAMVLLLTFVSLVATGSGLPKAEAAVVPLNQNLLVNPSFEDLSNGIPVGWDAYKGWSNNSQYVSADAARTGQNGIIIDKNDTGNPGVMQLVPVEEGAQYEMSVWMKSPTGFTGKGMGFTVEFYNSTPVGGATFVDSYNPNLLAAIPSNWVQMTRQVEAPKGAKYAYVYIRSHGTGKVSVDDMSFTKIKDPQAVKLDTNEIFYYSDKASGTVTADINMPQELYADRTLDLKISDSATGTVIASQNDTPISNRIVWQFDPRLMTLKDEFKVEANLKDSTGNVLEHQEKKIYRFNRPTSLAPDGSYLVNGSPFYPIYPYDARFPDYPNMPGEGYNATMGVSGGDVARITQWLDNAQASGLKIIIPIDKNHQLKEYYDYIATIVAATKDHPALLAWQLYDEPAGKFPLDEMAEVYRIIRTLDDVHPVILNEANPDFFERNGKVVDLLTTDPYPINGRPISMVGDYIRRAVVGVHGDKPVGAVLQTFFQAGNPNYGQLPTIDEVRNMVYQAIIAGAKGMGYYNYQKADSPLYAGLVKFQEEYPLIETLARLPKTAEQRADETEWATWTKGDDLYAVVLNHSTQTKTVNVSLPFSGYSGELLYGADHAKVSDFGSTLQVSIGSHQAYVYKLTSFQASAGQAASGLQAAKLLSNQSAWQARTDNALRSIAGLSQELSQPALDMKKVLDDATKSVRELELLTEWVQEQGAAKIGGNLPQIVEALQQAKAQIALIAQAQLQVTISLADGVMVRGGDASLTYSFTNEGSQDMSNLSVSVSFPESSGIQPYTGTIATLTPGQTITLNQSVPISDTLAAANVVVTVDVSYENKGVPLQVSESRGFPVINMVNASLTPSAITAKTIRTYNFALKLKNNVQTPIDVGLEATSQAGITASLPASVSLTPGQEQSVTGTVTIDSSSQDGNYVIPVQIMRDGKLIDSLSLAVQVSRNMITNPGFEDGANGAPTGWSIQSAVWDPTVAHSGTHSIKLSYAAGAANQFRMSSSNYVTVTPGKSYILSGWIKNSSTKGTFNLQARLISSTNTYISAAAPVNSDWTKVSIPFTAGPGVTQVALYFTVASGTDGPAWLDDVNLSEVASQ